MKMRSLINVGLNRVDVVISMIIQHCGHYFPSHLLYSSHPSFLPHPSLLFFVLYLVFFYPPIHVSPLVFPHMQRRRRKKSSNRSWLPRNVQWSSLYATDDVWTTEGQLGLEENRTCRFYKGLLLQKFFET